MRSEPGTKSKWRPSVQTEFAARLRAGFGLWSSPERFMLFCRPESRVSQPAAARRKRNPMSKCSFAGALIGLLCAAAALWPALAAEGAGGPNFSANGWDGDGENEFTPPKSGPGPVTSDPAHPYVSNFVAARTGAKANWRVADVGNPILKPWVIEALKKANEDALAGKAMFTREALCWPT